MRLPPMRELSLFTGAGGGLLGTLLLGWRTVGYVEVNTYCQQVIAARIKDGFLPEAPIFSDVRAFIREGYAKAYQGMVDVITAGFPCQPFSAAGKRLGANDERNMWPETIECIRLVRPEYALLENVSSLLTSGYFGTVLSDLAQSGYDTRWRVLSAAELGAPHRRDRVWIVAHTNSKRGAGTIQHQHRRNTKARLGSNGKVQSMADSNEDQQQLHQPGKQSEVSSRANSGRSGQNVAHAQGKRVGRLAMEREPQQKVANAAGESENVPNANANRCNKVEQQDGSAAEGNTLVSSIAQRGYGEEWWAVEPELGRVADGVAHRVDRLEAIGNGQVPAVARAAWTLLSGEQLLRGLTP